jgi:hypothetical protein
MPMARAFNADTDMPELLMQQITPFGEMPKLGQGEV